MNRLFSFILTKTKLLRLVAFLIVGWLVGAGFITEGDKSQVAEALLIVLTGIASFAIEAKKDTDAAKAQKEIGAKPDGWIGPKTRQEILFQTRAAAAVRHEMQTGVRRGGFFKG